MSLQEHIDAELGLLIEELRDWGYANYGDGFKENIERRFAEWLVTEFRRAEFCPDEEI